MNKNAIKSYAIWARNELIDKVSQKAYEYGIEKESNSISFNADTINGRILSSDEKSKRQSLLNEINHKGYDQVMEEVAYTWFNRFIALRFMEVNNYLPNRVRLFTNENNEFKPQILDEALHIELTGLDKNKVIQLKEANNEEELYKELLLATCNDMSQYLPGMFKPISDYMTLLFPSNLLREESVLGRLISDIDEDSWTDQVQIIGWLYQYYNTEPKDKVYARKSGTKIKKEEIPAVTQLFTPDWIVRYMTENSLGRLWLDGHPDTDIKSNWKYYLDEAEQEESVQIELNKIKAEHAKLTPQDIKFIDPCMGSGHILVYAFDVFMQIYVSEGWTEREAAKAILENNIYGLDIDERAYQLSYFALMMKARQYNRRILSEGIIPNVMAIEESNNFNKDLLYLFGDLKPLATRVIDIFIDAKEYGSILNVEFTKEELDSLDQKLIEIKKMADYGNLLEQSESITLVETFSPFLKQARIMSQKYECVVTNPPYTPISSCDDELQSYIKKRYPDSKSDFSSVFMEVTSNFSYRNGFISMINMHSWMFLTSYESLRSKLFDRCTFINMAHLGARAFEEIGGEVVQTTSFIFLNKQIHEFRSKFVRLVDFYSEYEKAKAFIDSINSNENTYENSVEQLDNIPTRPMVYWLTSKMFSIFSYSKLDAYANACKGLDTGENNRFLRIWFEVASDNVAIHNEGSKLKWIPYNKGGGYRKWYGLNGYCINWENNGYELKYNSKANIRNESYYFKQGITWSDLSTNNYGARFTPDGYIFDASGPTMFPTNIELETLLGYINTKVYQKILDVVCPGLHYNNGAISRTPIIIDISNDKKSIIKTFVSEQIYLSRADWDSFETSWDFKKHPLLPRLSIGSEAVYCDENEEMGSITHQADTIAMQYEFWSQECEDRFTQLKSNEEELNRIFIDIYGLQDELTPEVEDKDVTVRKADLTRDIKSLISYAVGCMFGRYSLDTEGLAYAGGEWDSSKYKTFIPDTDNIIPICDDEYFEDDIVGRFIEFIKVAYGEETLEENLQFIADALGGKGTSREVIRNYFLNDFFKDHCNTYQVTGSGKRPIYWQFDSGKRNGFKALIYIHRYTPDLIARMRTSYVHEQQSRYDNQLSMIQNKIDTAVSTSERVKAEKELKKIKDQADELRSYEEKIHRWADKMEPMDLDDGVKANYAKFQELLTKIK